MANYRPLSSISAGSAASAATAATAAVHAGALNPARHRLRAIDRDEVVPQGSLVDVAEFLPPGATWLPVPQHSVPGLPGRPPMVGYLVLVPADQHPAAAAQPAPADSDGSDGSAGPVRIDMVERVAVVNDQPLDLTYLEFELLAHLVAHPHRVHTRDQLVTTVWGYGHVGDGRTVDVHVARLRRKLGAEHRHTIQTVRRVGYKYTP
ncbi:transcriptional regulator [Streptomyces inusitatus]|uniref:Transcriptional regulator n=1 Tax=Streptomyces inusitatus TaxID=68221 RepID=A0A918PSX1_9ACTN|nr:winged helix-turn-helix domain-containing protein [Streptomyces inusitatus]GGZ20873.1 transcriptional regulator [Streptomyces inusitatus]